MMLTWCTVAGHDWRITSLATSNGIRWATWLCRRCPASIDYAAEWGKPAAGGILTAADVALVAIVAAAAAAIALASPST